MKANLKVEHDNVIKPNSTHFKELYLVMLFVQGIMKNPRSTDLYKNGFIDEKGDIKRMPRTQREWDKFSILDAFFIKIRYLLSSKLSELNPFNKIGTNSFLRNLDRVKLFGVNADHNMKLTNQLLNKFLNIRKDQTKL